MGLHYVNRKDDRYHLLEGKTKTGKPKYYAAKKPSAAGVPLDAMPNGYEWYENPENALVTVRKTKPTKIATFERELVERAIREQAGLEAFIVETAGDSLVVWLPNRQPSQVAGVFGSLFGMGEEKSRSMSDWTAKHARYSAMLRFTLRDAEKRLFMVERWCFRGGIDDWFYLAGLGPLEKLASGYVPHLGDESFYELI